MKSPKHKHSTTQFNFQRDTEASIANRILPEYYSPRKTRQKEK